MFSTWWSQKQQGCHPHRVSSPTRYRWGTGTLSHRPQLLLLTPWWWPGHSTAHCNTPTLFPLCRKNTCEYTVENKRYWHVLCRCTRGMDQEDSLDVGRELHVSSTLFQCFIATIKISIIMHLIYLERDSSSLSTLSASFFFEELDLLYSFAVFDYQFIPLDWK